MTTTDMLNHLTRHGADNHLRVPCSRYGTTTETVAPVAVAAALAYQEATGEEITTDLLDQLMGLAVNDDDDIEDLIDNYGGLGGSVAV